MTYSTARRGRIRAALGVAALVFVPLLQGCGDTKDTLLEAIDPDVIDPGRIQDAEGAQGLYIGTLSRLREITGGVGGEGSSWLFGGLLADEWSTASTFVQNDETDQRITQTNNGTVTGMFRNLARARTSSIQALKAMKEFRATETAKIAEIYFVRAFAEQQMANDYCNGIPLTDASEEKIVYGKPSTIAEVYQAAIASADSGLALVPATSTGDALRTRRALLITKARALVGLNQQAEAAALLGTTVIPSDFAYNVTYAVASGDLTLWTQPRSSLRYSVGDSAEGNARNILVRNAVPFFSARDPRVPSQYLVSTNGRDTTKAQDGRTNVRVTTLWARSSTVPVVNALDARLIEAEAQLKAQNITGMMTILNALRANPPKLGEIQPTAAQLPALPTPATQDAAITLYFREKAFWQFSRGHRLGDLRRLIRQYGRPANQVFPEGEHFRGGVYFRDVNLPVPQAEENNPVLNNAPACIDRNA